MPDFCDLGQKITETQYEHKMAELKSKMEQEGSERCKDCGEIIPKKRRELIPWCTRCVSCQEIFEG